MKIEQYTTKQHTESPIDNNTQTPQQETNYNKQEEKKITKSEVNGLLAKAARHYRKTIELKPKCIQALINWVKVLLLMDKVENTFDIDLQNNIIDIYEHDCYNDDEETETDVEADSENTQDEEATDSDYDDRDTRGNSSLNRTEHDITSKEKSEYVKKTNSGELVFSQEFDHKSLSSEPKLLDSFLVTQVKTFLNTYQQLFLQGFVSDCFFLLYFVHNFHLLFHFMARSSELVFYNLLGPC